MRKILGSFYCGVGGEEYGDSTAKGIIEDNIAVRRAPDGVAAAANYEEEGRKAMSKCVKLLLLSSCNVARNTQLRSHVASKREERESNTRVRGERIIRKRQNRLTCKILHCSVLVSDPQSRLMEVLLLNPLFISLRHLCFIMAIFRHVSTSSVRPASREDVHSESLGCTSSWSHTLSPPSRFSPSLDFLIMPSPTDVGLGAGRHHRHHSSSGSRF